METRRASEKQFSVNLGTANFKISTRGVNHDSTACALTPGNYLPAQNFSKPDKSVHTSCLVHLILMLCHWLKLSIRKNKVNGVLHTCRQALKLL